MRARAWAVLAALLSSLTTLTLIADPAHAVSGERIVSVKSKTYYGACVMYSTRTETDGLVESDRKGAPPRNAYRYTVNVSATYVTGYHLGSRQYVAKRIDAHAWVLRNGRLHKGIAAWKRQERVGKYWARSGPWVWQKNEPNEPGVVQTRRQTPWRPAAHGGIGDRIAVAIDSHDRKWYNRSHNAPRGRYDLNTCYVTFHSPKRP